MHGVRRFAVAAHTAKGGAFGSSARSTLTTIAGGVQIMVRYTRQARDGPARIMI